MKKIEKYLCIKNYDFYLKGNQYDFHFDSYYPLRLQIFTDSQNETPLEPDIFNKYFISVKEARKQKLKKLNGRN